MAEKGRKEEDEKGGESVRVWIEEAAGTELLLAAQLATKRRRSQQPAAAATTEGEKAF